MSLTCQRRSPKIDIREIHCEPLSTTNDFLELFLLEKTLMCYLLNVKHRKFVPQVWGFNREKNITLSKSRCLSKNNLMQHARRNELNTSPSSGLSQTFVPAMASDILVLAPVLQRCMEVQARDEVLARCSDKNMSTGDQMRIVLLLLRPE